MEFLGLPPAANDDDATLASLLQYKIWSPHDKPWQAAYKAYRENHGNPWQIEPCVFEEDLTKRQGNLYKSRSLKSPINDIRRMPGLSCCPVCGSKTTDAVDHYLPKGVYGEFAIMIANLVPACSMCNSTAKGETVKGENAPERFIHPYFDAFAGEPLWEAHVEPPFVAATFTPRPLNTLPEDIQTIVSFHLANVLNWHFHREMDTQWSKLPHLLRIEVGTDDEITVAQAEAFLEKCLKYCEVTEGRNGWRTALHRGVIGDEACLEFVRQRASQPDEIAGLQPLGA